MVTARCLPAVSVTAWISDLAANATMDDLSDVTVARSKRMMLDTLGVGILGFGSEATRKIMSCMLQCYSTTKGESAIWGSNGTCGNSVRIVDT